MLIVKNLVYDFIGSIRQVNQNPAKFLFEIVLDLSKVSILLEWVRVNPVQEALQKKDDLCAFVNFKHRNLFLVSQDSSQGHNYRKLIN